MKKYILTTVFALGSLAAAFGQIYIGKATEVSFFSTAPLENITAINKSTRPILNTSTNDVMVKISIQGFTFAKPLMQEHFNENYMEIEKYPDATFKGKIVEKIDWTKDGTHNVTIMGKLMIHGVEKERTLNATMVIKGGEITVDSKFNVALKDHNITVPELVFQKIAETVEVKLHSVLIQNVKK
jgi:hypothetical protein